jgi:hypothetical protein
LAQHGTQSLGNKPVILATPLRLKPTPVANNHPKIEATSFTDAPTGRRTSGIRWLHRSAGREFMIPEETR